jgi:hypothetical protein
MPTKQSTKVLTPQEEMKHLQEHVKAFEREFLSKDRVPPKDAWRPHRFAMRDVILGIAVIRHNARSRKYDPKRHLETMFSTGNNTLQVDFCLSENPPFLPEYEGTKILALFLLSEAFMCGSSMEIEFTPNVNGGRVPGLLYDLAFLNHVQLRHADRGRITPKEARQLYLNLTGFSEDVQTKIMELALGGEVKPERVCYMVNSGIWKREEIEILLMGSTFPDLALLGDIDFERYLLMENCMLQARTAVMGGTLLRKLAYREVLRDGKAVDVEATERILKARFNPEYHALEITCDEDLPIPWLDEDIKVKAGQVVMVMLVSRDGTSTYLRKKADLELLGNMIENQTARPKKHFFLLLSVDAQDKDGAEYKKYKRRVEALEANLLLCPINVSDLDSDALQRLEKSKVTRL